MLGRTHFFIGISAALAIMQPSSMSTLVAGAGAAAIGGMISDIDSGTSQAHKEGRQDHDSSHCCYCHSIFR